MSKLVGLLAELFAQWRFRTQLADRDTFLTMATGRSTADVGHAGSLPVFVALFRILILNGQSAHNRIAYVIKRFHAVVRPKTTALT
jgi:hypothetical protein